jgi:hypothetical protein
VVYNGHTIKAYLKEVKTTFSQEAYTALSKIILQSNTIADELQGLLKGLDDKRLHILIRRFGFRRETLGDIARDEGISRERVRQLGKMMRITVLQNFNSYPNTRLQTAIHIARDMGDDFTVDHWKNVIIRAGLVGNLTSEDSQFMKLMIALCNLACEEFQEFSLPENVVDSIKASELTGRVISARSSTLLKKLSKESRKLIKRQTNFSGAASVQYLSGQLRINANTVVEILEILGYRKVTPSWCAFSISSPPSDLNKQHVMFFAVKKMLVVCGALPASEIHIGLKHALRRSGFPAPPTDVLDLILLSYGFERLEDLWAWRGEQDVSPSEGEWIVLDCIAKNGLIVHHAEIASAFMDAGLSYPAVSKTLTHSPLFAKVAQGLYRALGTVYTAEDIERANNALGYTPTEPSVTYTLNGTIEFEINLGTLVIGTGVISSEKLPNLEGTWKYYPDGILTADIVVTRNEIRHLKNAIRALDCAVGDRVRLIFDSFSRTVSMEKIGH